MLASTSVDTVLLVLKIAFLVLLYLFIWRIVRTAGKEGRSTQAQESFILRPGTAALESGRLVVLQSTNVKEGEEFELDSASFTIGRGGQNDVALEGDEYASAKHVRIEPRRDGVWVHDLGSTNGTFVNGVQIEKPRKLSQGDVVQLGNGRGRTRLHARLVESVKPGVLVSEGIWPPSAFLDGWGINVLVGDDSVAPYGGTAFHDVSVWARRA